jgi:dihydroceramidase
VYLAWRGIGNTKRNGGEKVIVLCYAMLGFVGPASMAYHISIKYTGQMSKWLILPPNTTLIVVCVVDEFSMMYATAAILYAVLSVTLGPETHHFLGGLVAGIAIAASLVHYRLNHTPGFQTLFGLMVFTVFSQCVWLLNFKVKSPDAVKDMKHLALYGAGRCNAE